MNDGAGAMTVLMTADTLGGVWTYALELAGGLREYALEWMAEPWRELETQVAPDLVHVNGFAHAAVPFAAPVLSVAHSCVCTWWRAVHGVDAPPSWDEYRRRVAAGLAAAEVVAPTAAILGDILAAHHADRPGRVICNGVDPSRHRPAAKQPLVLAAGRLWDQAKNLAILEACAAEVPWPIYVAGPVERPGGGSVSPRAVRSLGCLTGDQVADWMGRAAIYAAPARYEPFGLAIVEAALAGCALVLGDVPTLRELWGDASLYVSPDDPAAMTAALTALIDDAYHALYRELA